MKCAINDRFLVFLLDYSDIIHIFAPRTMRISDTAPGCSPGGKGRNSDLKGLWIPRWIGSPEGRVQSQHAGGVDHESGASRSVLYRYPNYEEYHIT